MTPPTSSQLHLTIRLLHTLNVPVHRNGYRHLCIAIPCYAQDNSQWITKELYPYVARHSGSSNAIAVEHAIRTAIFDAWTRRDPEVWKRYFPHCDKAPSNKLFISVLAEQLIQNTPPENGRGLITRRIFRHDTSFMPRQF